jgi:hypothetical protein
MRKEEILNPLVELYHLNPWVKEKWSSAMDEWAKEIAIGFAEQLRNNPDIFINYGNDYDKGFYYNKQHMNAEQLFQSYLNTLIQ